MAKIRAHQCLSDAFEPCEWSLDEELSTMLDILDAIPDGMHLADFPGHCESAECWCRPQVDVVLGKILVHHKNLAEGQFDS